MPPPIPSQPEDFEEHRLLQRFQMVTVPAFAGSLDSSFWPYLVPRFSQSDPVIRHATIALAALHEEQQVNGAIIKAVNQNPLYLRSLQHYSHALALLNSRLMENNGSNSEPSLIACVLFISYEILQGDVRAALVHLDGGLSVVLDYHSSIGEASGVAVKMLVSYELQSYILDQNRAVRLDGASQRLAAFANLEQARTELEALLREAQLFLRTEKPAPDDIYSLSTLTDRGNEIYASIDQWTGKLQILQTGRQAGVVDNEEALAFLPLRAQALTTQAALLSHTLTPAELFTSQFEPQMDSAMELIETYVASQPVSSQGQRFTLYPAIIQPLFYAARLSTNAPLRRRAITLLESAGVEGFWDGALMASIASKTLEIEERCLLAFRRAEASAAVAAVRCRDVEVSLDPEGRNLLLQCRLALPGGAGTGASPLGEEQEQFFRESVDLELGRIGIGKLPASEGWMVWP